MKMKLKRKELLGVLLGLALALGLVPGIAMTALADPSDGDLNIVEIGDGNTTTYVTPYNSLWGYSCVEQIYTADEIGEAGIIRTIAFNLIENSSSQTCDFDVWLVPVAQDTFVETADFVNMDSEACNYAGQITFSTGWTTITLQEPFVYDGASNVLVCFHEKTPGYSTRYFYMHNAEGKVLSFHSDSNDPNPTDLGTYGGSKYTSGNRCNIRFGISPLHTHDLTYTADGATVTATCSNADGKCALDDGTELHGHAAALTIVAPTLTTYGQTGEGVSESATLDGADAFNAATGLGASADSIRYYAATKDGDSYAKGDEALAAAPTGAGDYVAELTLAGVKTGPEATGDVTASVGYTIARAATAVTEIPMAGGITYGQTLADSALTGGQASVEGAFAWADDTIAPEVADSQRAEYDVVFTPSDANHAAATCRVTLAVGRAASAVAEAPTATAPAYTGSAQELVSAGRATGGEMRYAIGTEAGATGPYAASVPAATEVGAYRVWYKVAGDDNHEDSEPASVAASIGRADISKAKVTLARASYAYDGKAKEPKAKVTLGGRKLRADTDFSVSYKGNTKVGTATVTVTGQGNYQGTAKATFSIVPARVAGLTTAGHPARGTLDASWNAVAGAASYQLSWRKAGGKWKSRTVKGTGAAIEGLKAGGRYEVRVRAKAGSATGAWSKVAGRWLSKASSLKAVAGKSKGTVRVSWAADAQATGGYVAYACAKKDGKVLARRAVAAGKTSATLKGLKSGKAYYVKVRPLRESSGTTYAGVQRYCKATVKAK